ncbi:hypothetical protein C8J56DRAFT_410128 [Mycena floridula]|nr:hypothetical protein C8J56DRAFT_410128 [Mycena floridula]
MKRGFLLGAEAKRHKRDGVKATSKSDDKALKPTGLEEPGNILKYGVLAETGPPAGYNPKPLTSIPLEKAGDKLNPHDNFLLMTTMPPPDHPKLPNRSDGFTECWISGYIKKACLKFPGFPAEVPRPVIPAHRIAKTATKGLGVFATRKILAGELLFAERPFFITPSNLEVPQQAFEGGYSQDQLQQIALHERERRLEALFHRIDSNEVKARLMALHNSHKHDGSGSIQGIIRTNAFGAPDPLRHKENKGGKVDHSILCDQGSRINHSCTPNSGYDWDAASFSIKFWAIRDVEEGEEITYSYVRCGIAASSAVRQKALEPYGFRCTCTACLNPEVSDARRRTVTQFFGTSEDTAEIGSRALNWLFMPDDEFFRTFKGHLETCELEEMQGSAAYKWCCTMLSSRYGFLADERNCVKYARLEAYVQGERLTDDELLARCKADVYWDMGRKIGRR